MGRAVCRGEEIDMNIGLIHIDGKMPNLALMKLSAYHKSIGDKVKIIDLSSLGINKWYASNIFAGGSGYDIKSKLPDEIEEMCPDYNLYNMDYSMGFTSRGCIRDCKFCIVREKEGYLRDVDYKQHIKHSKYIVMDNNFLACKTWKDKIQYFIDNDIKVSFNQGLDIKLINDNNAEMLSKVKYYDRKFNARKLYFAFDDPNDEDVFRKKIKILLKYIKPRHIMVYILVGFNTTFEEDIYRFNIVYHGYGCEPYIMLYNKSFIKHKKKLIDFQRWVNRRLYKVCKFEDYKKQKGEKK